VIGKNGTICYIGKQLDQTALERCVKRQYILQENYGYKTIDVEEDLNKVE